MLIDTHANRPVLCNFIPRLHCSKSSSAVMQQDKYELQKLKQAAFLEKNIILNRRIWKNCSKQFLFYINFLN